MMMMMWERETRNSSKKEVSEKERQMLFVPEENLISLYVKEDSKNKNEKKSLMNESVFLQKKKTKN